MPNKTSKTSITSATQRLSLEIAKPHAAVWKAFVGEIHSWWPKDFYATESPQRIVFEVKPGGDSRRVRQRERTRLVSRDRSECAELDHAVGVHRAAFRRPGDFSAQRFVFGKGQSATAMEVAPFHIRLSGRH